MDSPANTTGFYDDLSAKLHVVKREQPEPQAFDLEEQSGEFGLDFFQSEESIDIGAYIEGRLDTSTTGDEIVRQFGGIAGQQQQRYMNEAPAVIPGPQPPQLTDLSAQHPSSTGAMHYQNMIQQTQTVTIPMNVPSQPHAIGEQMQNDSIVPDSYLTAGAYQNIEQVIEVQDVHSTSTSNASSPGIPMNEMADSPGGSSTGNGSKRKRPAPPPGTVEYQVKRERNNIAVRKSRLKTKQKNKELQDKVGELQGENSSLKKRVEMLTKELTVLKSLFTNVGKSAPARLAKAVE